MIKSRRFAGVILYAIAFYFAMFTLKADYGSAFGLALLFYPLCIGLIAPLMIDPAHKMDYWPVFWLTVLGYAITATILIALGRETAICLIIGAPIFLMMTAVGVEIARHALRRHTIEDAPKTKAMLIALPFALAFVNMDVTFPLSAERRVDRVTINAPADAVWDAIVTFPQIAQEERLWTVSHNILGAPVPLSSQMERDIRHAYWSMGVDYQEHLTATDKPIHMAWDIVFADDFDMDRIDDHIQPNSDQLRLLRGQYDVTAQGDQTVLTSTTDYQLRTLSNAYIRLWGGLFLGDNHQSILHVIKLRAERAS